MKKVLTMKTISPNLLKAEYAVRGKIPQRANELKEEIAKDSSSHSFSSIAQLNIGNPQAFPFNKVHSIRNVVSEIVKRSVHPETNSTRNVENKTLNDEINVLAQKYLKKIQFQNAYSNLNGSIPSDAISKFIYQRDGLNSNPDHIFSSNGASTAIKTIINLLIDNKQAGIMVSVPTYPLYTALGSFYNGTLIPYYLNESDNWNVSLSELESAYQNAVKNGVNPKAFSLINPGNPTGSVMSRKSLEEIVQFCYDRNLLLLADEVYQENIYDQNKEFISIKKILHESDINIRDNLEIASFHTLSKGLLAECGLRGGYMELENISEDMIDVVRELARRATPNIIGDIVLDLKSNFMANEFQHRYQELHNFFEKETNEIFQDFKTRANECYNILNSCEGITCNPIEGAMYAFPTIDLPKKFIQKAEEKNVKADFLYCINLLEKTGICTVPGSGFGQKEGTWHFRSTILPSPVEHLVDIMHNLKEYNDKLHEQYS